VAPAAGLRYISGMPSALITRLQDPRAPLLIVLAASLAALASAFAGEHLFGLQPCILCLYERVPWAAAAAVAALGLIVTPRPWRLAALALCGTIFLAGAALAFYHVGVEAHWWASIAGCEVAGVGGFSLEDLHGPALAEPLKPCDQVDFRLLGLSLAGWNVVLSAAAAAFSALAFVYLSRRTAHP
jgi:disulfide bond formation protein DsbB